MKKVKNMFALMCAGIVLSFSLMSGCGNKDAGEKENTNTLSADEEGVVVDNVKDFLDAIESDTVIILKKGSYNMTPELEKLYDEYGKDWNREHINVKLESDGDSVYFTIEHVKNLTIKGQDGKNVELMIEPRYADVLAFNYCKNISISNMTIGHTEMPGYCSGAVLEFDDCSTVNLDDLDLYGCGTYGYEAYNTDNIVLSNSVIRDCSEGIVSAVACTDLTFTKSEFYGNAGYSSLSIYGEGATFTKCKFYDNSFSTSLIDPYIENACFKFNECSFGPLETMSINTSEIASEAQFDSKCTFDNNYSEEDLIDNTSPDNNDWDDCEGQQPEYDVENYEIVKDIIDQIKPGATVVIPAGIHNISDYLYYVDYDVFAEEHPYAVIEESFDGPVLVIHDIDGLTLVGENADDYNNGDELIGENGEVTLVTDPRYADVIAFRNCKNITLSCFTVGHTEGGSCDGDVLSFEECSNVVIRNMSLYGCGVIGINAVNSGNFDIVNTYIHDCSWTFGCIDYPTGYFRFKNCSFMNNGGTLIGWEINEDIIFINCSFGENESQILVYEGSDDPEDHIVLEDCEFDVVG